MLKKFIITGITLITVSCSDIPTTTNQSSKPVFNYPEGIYGHEVDISIKSNTPSKIYYTIDGSNPDQNSILYKSPIKLDEIGKEFIIKAVSKEPCKEISESVSSAYRIVYSGTEDNICWNKTLNFSVATSIVVDSNHDVYTAGYQEMEKSKEDWLIKKFDNNGNEDTINWNVVFDGNNALDAVRTMLIDHNNNIYVAGTGTNINSKNSGYDWWIKKFDSNGNEINKGWNKIFDCREGQDYINAIAVDYENNIYVAGSGEKLLSPTSTQDFWIKKFSPGGVEDKINWNKIFDGNNGEDYINSIAIDSKNNLYIAGSGENIAGENSKFDWWIKKFDSNGNEDLTNWNKIFDGNNENDYANSIVIDSNDNVFVIGSGENLCSPISLSDWWIKKFNSDGNEDILYWNKMLDGKNGDDYLNSATVDSKGNLYVAGAGYKLINGISDFDWWIAKFNVKGEIDTVYLDKVYDGNGGEDYANALFIDKNNNLFVSGYRNVKVDGSIKRKDWWIKKFYN